MLEYLKLYIGTMEGVTKVTVTVENGIVKASVDTPFFQIEVDDIRLSKQESRIWLAALENIHIERWQSKYMPDEIAYDGESWKLEYKRADKRCRHINGDDTYPENWDEFLKVMDILAPLINPKRVEKIDIKYNRKIKIPASQGLNLPEGFVVWDYFEQLTIDRATEKLIIKQKFGTDCVVTKEYYIREGISELLYSIEEYLEEPVNIATLKENAMATYELAVDYHKHESLKLRGAYNRNGLPEYWYVLMDEITDFLSFCGRFGEMFNPDFFKKGVRPGEYIYCSVLLDSLGGTYYYTSEDDSINVGDYVIVPVGAGNKELRGQVEEIEYYTAEDVPFPLDKTKVICRKTDAPTGDDSIDNEDEYID